MAQVVSFETLPTEEAAILLRQRMVMFAGYAFALAQKAGLSAEEAAQFFMKQHQVDISHGEANSEVLEHQAKSSAAGMALMHGSSNVQLEREGDSWIVKTKLTDDISEFQQWEVPLEFFVRWAGEQARLIGEPKGVKYTTWLESETLCMRITFLPKG